MTDSEVSRIHKAKAGSYKAPKQEVCCYCGHPIGPRQAVDIDDRGRMGHHRRIECVR